MCNKWHTKLMIAMAKCKDACNVLLLDAERIFMSFLKSTLHFSSICVQLIISMCVCRIKIEARTRAEALSLPRIKVIKTIS